MRMGRPSRLSPEGPSSSPPTTPDLSEHANVSASGVAWAAASGNGRAPSTPGDVASASRADEPDASTLAALRAGVAVAQAEVASLRAQLKESDAARQHTEAEARLMVDDALSFTTMATTDVSKELVTLLEAAMDAVADGRHQASLLRLEKSRISSELHDARAQLEGAQAEAKRAGDMERMLTIRLESAEEGLLQERIAKDAYQAALVAVEAEKHTAIKEVVALRAQFNLTGSPVLQAQSLAPPSANDPSSFARGEEALDGAEMIPPPVTPTSTEQMDRGFQPLAAAAERSLLLAVGERSVEGVTISSAEAPAVAAAKAEVAAAHVRLGRAEAAVTAKEGQGRMARDARRRSPPYDPVCVAGGARDGTTPICVPPSPSLQPAGAHSGGTWSPSTLAGPQTVGLGAATPSSLAPPRLSSTSRSPGFCSSYIDVSTASIGAAAAASDGDLEEARRTAIMATIQGKVLAELLDAAREAFTFWHIWASSQPMVAGDEEVLI